MKVLLTGATGFLGGHVLRACLEAGHEVRALLRETSRTHLITDLLADERVERFDGDVTDAPRVALAARGVDAIIHSAGLISLRPADVPLMERIQVDGTRNVLAAGRAAFVNRIVYTSTSTLVGMSNRQGPVYGDDDEIRPEAAPIAYVRTKIEAERHVKDAEREGLPVIRLAPGCLLGPGDHYVSSTDMILRALRGEVPVYLEGGFSFVDVRDAAAAHVAALDHGETGRRYLLAGENLTIEELFDRVARIGGVKRPRHKLPRGIAMFSGLLAEAFDKTETVSRDAVRMATLFNYVASPKAARELGFCNRPVDRSIEDTITWFRQAGYVDMPAPELRRIRRT